MKSDNKPFWLPDTQGFLAVAILALVGAISFILLLHNSSMDDKTASTLTIVLGVLVAALKDVYSFFFGSSKGSEKKDDALISGAVSPTSTPPIVPPSQPIGVGDAPKVIAFLAVMLTGLMLFGGGDASAQGLRKPQITGDFVNDAKANLGVGKTATTPATGTQIGDSGCKATGDAISDLHCVIKAGGATLILHLKQSYALASAPGANGGTTDNTSAMCTKALVPIVDLVVNGPKAGTLAAGDPMALTTDEQAKAATPGEPDGPIVVIEKIRILRLAIQSPALNDACGALVQDEVKNAQSLVGKVTSLITGAGILAPLGL